MPEDINNIIKEIIPDPTQAEAIKTFLDAVDAYDENAKMVFLEALANDERMLKSLIEDLKQDHIPNAIFVKYYNGLITAGMSPGEKNPQEIMAKMVFLQNLQLHAQRLKIPLMSGFDDVNDGTDPHTIISCTNGHGISYGLTADGPLEQNESFEERIDLVRSNEAKFIRTLSPLNTDKSSFFYKDYDGPTFKFKIYIRDMIIERGGESDYVRTLNAYFIEPTMNDFYQLSVSAGPFSYPSESIKVGEPSEDAQLMQILIQILTTIMDNLGYFD